MGILSLITLEIPWEPVPWASPKLSRHGAYDPREKDKRAIRQCIRQQYGGEVHVGHYYCIEFEFYFVPPKSASKKKKASMIAGYDHPTKCDCTNLQKLYEDCLKGIVIEDDRYVIDIHSCKLYSDKARAIIHIRVLDHLPPHANNNFGLSSSSCK